MRDAVNELYDHGCDLVAAATGIRDAAARTDTARAVPAVLGCMETALDALFQAATELQATLRASLEGVPDDATRRRAARGIAELEGTLGDAHVAAAAARALSARSLSRAGVTSR